MKKFLLLVLFIFHYASPGFGQISLVKQFDLCCQIGTFENVDNLVIFNANGGLWRSDGTSAGTFQLTASASFNTYSFRRIKLGNVVYFWGDIFLQQLWKTDGTVAGTVLVKAFPEGRFYDSMANLNGLLVFSFRTNSTGTELWRSDGTEAGTFMVTDLVPGSGDGVVYASTQSPVLDGYFYFQGPADPALTGTRNIAEGRPTLYRTDGTAAGTTMVANGGYSPNYMTVMDGRLVYQALSVYTDIYGSPCFSQPTSTADLITVLMKVENGVASVLKYPADIKKCGKFVPLGSTFINSSKFIKSSNYLYFIGQLEVDNNGQTAYNLWRTDGTPNGTIQLTSFASGSNEGPFGSMFDSNTISDFGFNTIAYFPIYTNAEGSELWRSDGTPAGTYLLKDINPGPAGSGAGAYNGTGNPNTNTGPLDFRVVNGTTYFYATEGTNGVELWRTDGTSTGTLLVQNLNPGSASQPVTSTGNWADKYYGISAGNTYYFFGDNGSQKGLYAVSFTPDLYPTMYLRPNALKGIKPIMLVVNIGELKSAATSGTITVRITKDHSVNLSLDHQATLVNGHTVQNSLWNLTTDDTHYILTTTAQINANGELAFGLTGTLTPDGTSGRLVMSTVIDGGSGGEVKSTNNFASNVIDYFQK